MQKVLLIILYVVAGLLWQVGAQPLQPPAGTFRLGISTDDGSRWLQGDEEVAGLQCEWLALPDSAGFLLAVTPLKGCAVDTLYWSYGDCVPDSDVNVFNVEGRVIGCYYGESRRLRYASCIVASEDIKLCDGHCDETPRQLYYSGKRTTRPLVAGRCPLQQDQTLYFCFYRRTRQHRQEYTHYMLPKLHEELREQSRTSRK